MSKEKIIVNSWNEWDPLKHVIVGKADGTCASSVELIYDDEILMTLNSPFSKYRLNTFCTY